MRRDAVFGEFVHLARADLQLDALLARPNHGGVDRAIVVLLGGRDVVLEAARDHRPCRVHDAERLVAFGQRLHDDAETDDVGELLEPDRFALHLAPDRVGTLAATGYLRSSPAIGEFLGELLLDLRDEADIARLQRRQPVANDLISIGVELAECQVFEFLAHLMHAHAPGERGIDVERFLGDAPARNRGHVRQRAHVVEAVSELDQ